MGAGIFTYGSRKSGRILTHILEVNHVYHKAVSNTAEIWSRVATLRETAGSLRQRFHYGWFGSSFSRILNRNKTTQFSVHVKYERSELSCKDRLKYLM